MNFQPVILGQEPDPNSFVYGGERESLKFNSQLIPIGAHLVLFGILGTLLSITFQITEYSSIKHFNILSIVLIGLGWGILTELYQLSVPGRYASVADVITDLVGAVIGGFLTLQMTRFLSRRMI